MKLSQFLTAPKKPKCPPNEVVRDPGGFTPAFLPVVLLLVLMFLALAGCGATPVADPDFKPTPVTFNIQVPYLCGQPPAVGVVLMRDVNWDIITLDDIDLFTLTVGGYKSLGMNTSDWIAASREMKAQRDFYRDCIKRSQEEIHDENLDTGLVPNIPNE
jgi:hypothetical protein